MNVEASVKSKFTFWARVARALILCLTSPNGCMALFRGYTYCVHVTRLEYNVCQKYWTTTYNQVARLEGRFTRDETGLFTT